jgi:hypothetical protein
MPLLELMVPPTVVGADAIGQSSLSNRTIRFAQFQIGVFDSYSFNANKMIHSSWIPHEDSEHVFHNQETSLTTLNVSISDWCFAKRKRLVNVKCSTLDACGPHRDRGRSRRGSQPTASSRSRGPHARIHSDLICSRGEVDGYEAPNNLFDNILELENDIVIFFIPQPRNKG